MEEKENKGNYTIDDAKNAILNVQKIYGTEMAKIVEKMYRLETAHFKSSQFVLTGTAGMEQGKWSNVPKLDTIPLKDPILGMRDYLIWNPKDFAVYLAEYIKRFDGNFARWNSTNTTRQSEYRKRVNSINNKFV